MSRLKSRAILQTGDGYLWLGTQEGIARFDGTRFTVFDTRNTPGLRNNDVFRLLEDREGNLWVGTGGGGLSRLRGGRVVTYTTRDGLPRILLVEDSPRDAELALEALEAHHLANEFFHVRDGADARARS